MRCATASLATPIRASCCAPASATGEATALADCRLNHGIAVDAAHVPSELCRAAPHTAMQPLLDVVDAVRLQRAVRPRHCQAAAGRGATMQADEADGIV